MSKCSPPTPSAFASLTRPTLPATKPGPARVSWILVRKSGKPDFRGREVSSGASPRQRARRVVEQLVDRELAEDELLHQRHVDRELERPAHVRDAEAQRVELAV